MQSSYYAYGGITRAPKEGSYAQTSGIGSRWVNPEFGQPIGKYSNMPVKDSEKILSSNPHSPANTSYVGALQRVDPMIRIVEQPGDLAKAPKLPNQKLTESMINNNRLMLNAQTSFMLAQKSGDNERMRQLMNRGSDIQSRM